MGEVSRRRGEVVNVAVGRAALARAQTRGIDTPPLGVEDIHVI